VVGAGRCALGALAGLLAILPGTPSSAAPGEPGERAGTATESVRVALYGDSVTQGAAGDYTWRYRLWHHLESIGAGVDLVGPRDDLYDHLRGAHGSHAYVDPAFDSDHASRWGMTMAMADQSADDLVRDHDVDVLVSLLGFNDLVYLDLSPDQIGDLASGVVAGARTADPGVSVVLAEASQQWHPGVAELNAALADVAADLDEPTSRVVVATLPDGREARTATWDGSHPSAAGEVDIAASVADALAEVGVGAPYPRPLPTVPLGPRRAPVLRGRAVDAGAALSWTQVPGVDRVRVSVRDVSRGDRFRELAPVGGLSWSTRNLVNGHVYEFRLRPQRGWLPAATDIRSNTVRLRPLPPLPATVPNLRIGHPRADWVRVVGGRVARARSYRLLSAPARTCAGPVPRLRVTARRLYTPEALATTRAPRLWVRMVAVNEAGEGPGRSRCVVVR